jgi:hypothetical protein
LNNKTAGGGLFIFGLFALGLGVLELLDGYQGGACVLFILAILTMGVGLSGASKNE